MVATLVLRLVGQGVLELDAPLSTYLPDAPFGQVTLRQLLSHSAGVPDFGREPSYAQLLFIQPGRVWTADEVVGLVADEDLDFEPGRRTSYSNTGYVLAGMAAEAAAGEPLAELLRQQVILPAGLDATYLEEMEDSPAMAVNGHFDIDGDGSPDNVAGVPYTALVTSGAAAGGISASAMDVLDFGTALFEGGLLSEGALAEMTSFQAGAAGQGLGLIRTTREGREIWGHDGALPGFSAAFGYLPQERVIVVAMSNQTGANVHTLIQRVLSEAAVDD
jgi:D-alanyl-D-alanine carboxypeptidase